MSKIESDGHIKECGNGGDDPEDCSPACVAARRTRPEERISDAALAHMLAEVRAGRGSKLGPSVDALVRDLADARDAIRWLRGAYDNRARAADPSSVPRTDDSEGAP